MNNFLAGLKQSNILQGRDRLAAEQLK